jgi:hypothetical protein
MTTAAIAPRWRGEPGFFEIWFVVAFDRSAERAWWVRYTTFAPREGVPRATIWAAAFAGGRPPVWGKTFVPMERVREAVAALAEGVCEGHVEAGGHRLAWKLAIDPPVRALRRGPRWLEHAPAPTRVAHVTAEAEVDGIVWIDDVEQVMWDGPATMKHLWGTRRVEELYWVYCPTLEGGGAFEATGVRVRRGTGPVLAPVWLKHRWRESRWWGVPGLFRNRVVPDGSGRIRVHAASPTRVVDAVAVCDPATLAGFVYRDPAGWDVHVAQSDVARCELTLRTRAHPLAGWGAAERLVGGPAAVEFHHPDPLPGVRYVAWDATAPKEIAR